MRWWNLRRLGMHAAMLADVKPGKKIVILGAGCIGLMTLQACKCLGATEIAVVDVLDKRLAMAEQLGGDNRDQRCKRGHHCPLPTVLWRGRGHCFLKPPVQPSPLSRRRIW